MRDGNWNVSFGDSYSNNKKFHCWNEEAFDTKDFPVIDAFHTFDPINILTIFPLKYGLWSISNYGNKKVNICQEQRNEASIILKCGEETF